MIPVGIVVKPHGLRGEVKMKSHSDLAIFANIEDVILRDPKTEKTVTASIEAIRPSGEGFIVLFEGFDSIGIAERIRGYEVIVPKEALPPLKAGEYYFFQLMGCSVYDETGRLVGEVDDIIETGANEVIVIKQKQADLSITEELIPVIKDYVLDMNLDARKIVVKTVHYEDDGETR